MKLLDGALHEKFKSRLKRTLNSWVDGIGTDNEKNRNTWLHITLSALTPGESILDAGAGWLRNKPLCGHLHYKSQDFCQYDGLGDGVALQNGSWDTSGIDIVSDITSIPVANNSFDNVLCSEVLEHVPDPVATIKELVRVLKPAGRLIVTVPFLMPTHQTPYYFTSGLSRYWCEHYVKEFGCEIVELKTNGDFYSHLAQELRRLISLNREITNRRTSFSIISLVYALLVLLRRAQKKSNDSSDISAYGYFLAARKIKP